MCVRWLHGNDIDRAPCVAALTGGGGSLVWPHHLMRVLAASLIINCASHARRNGRSA